MSDNIERNNSIIKKYEFKDEGREQSLLDDNRAINWPVVYLINNDKELYIGETQSFANRFSQHLENDKRKKLTDIRVIYDDEFNKSSILDMESWLIQFFSADYTEKDKKKFKLQNDNNGQSLKHNYYQKSGYFLKRKYIWDLLINEGLAHNSYSFIKNSNTFKFSPYNTLTSEQYKISIDVFKAMISYFGKSNNEKEISTFLIEGGAGTGKTVLAIHIINEIVKLIDRPLNSKRLNLDFNDDADEEDFYLCKLKPLLESDLKIAFLLPMIGLRTTLKSVFKDCGLSRKISFINPCDLSRKSFDIIFVDEAHRLQRRTNLRWMKPFDNASRKLGFDPKNSNVLDWVYARSRFQVIFYDRDQSIKPTDIPTDDFLRIVNKHLIGCEKLSSELRVKGGNDYLDYVNNLLSCKLKEMKSFYSPDSNKNYDFYLFDDVNDMYKEIIKKDDDSEMGLSRMTAGFAWEWISEGKSLKEVKENDLYDIHIGNYKYAWNIDSNVDNTDKNSLYRIECIHSTQGYDLNYCGLIFGPEIDYDPVNNKIVVYLDKFYDVNVKKNCSESEAKQFIINAYKVMLERGIHGTYVYACNSNLREYFAQFIENFKEKKINEEDIQ